MKHHPRFPPPMPEEFPGFDDIAALAIWISRVRSVAFIGGARHDEISTAEAEALVAAVTARPSTGVGAEARSISERARELLDRAIEEAGDAYASGQTDEDAWAKSIALRAIESALSDRGTEG